MTIVDNRLTSKEIDLVHSIVGKKLISIYHDPFMFVNSSSQIVQINVENKTFYLYSFTEPMEHFGTKEDVAVWSFETERYKAVDTKTFIEMPFNEIVKSICVIQENQQLYKNGELIHDVWLTRGIIIDFGDYQLSFEKAIWFSEDIYIRKGYNLIDEFEPEEKFINSDWGKGYSAKCHRELVLLD